MVIEIYALSFKDIWPPISYDMTMNMVGCRWVKHCTIQTVINIDVSQG